MKPKNLLVISTHSFVDLITNSSSELFVCDTEKTINAVKDLLTTLLHNHDEIEGESHTFDSVFGTIAVAKYCFQWWDVPEDIREQYEHYHRYCSYGRNPYELNYSRGRSIEEETLEDKEQKLEDKHNVHEKNIEPRETKRRWDACRKEVDVLWTDFGANKLAVENRLFLNFLQQNKFSKEKIAKAIKVCDSEVERHRAEKAGQYCWFKAKFSTPVLNEAYEVFHEWSSWGITAKKGTIFVYSSSDNTIPYKLMDTISSYLNADRYHLG